MKDDVNDYLYWAHGFFFDVVFRSLSKFFNEFLFLFKFSFCQFGVCKAFVLFENADIDFIHDSLL